MRFPLFGLRHRNGEHSGYRSGSGARGAAGGFRGHASDWMSFKVLPTQTTCGFPNTHRLHHGTLHSHHDQSNQFVPASRIHMAPLPLGQHFPE